MDLPVFAKKGGIAPIGVFNELWCTPAIAATCGMCFKIKVQPGYETARCKRDGFFAHPECPGTVDGDHSYADHPGMEWAFNYAVYYDDPDGIPYIIGMNVEYVGCDRCDGRGGGEGVGRAWNGGGGGVAQWPTRSGLLAGAPVDSVDGRTASFCGFEGSTPPLTTALFSLS